MSKVQVINTPDTIKGNASDEVKAFVTRIMYGFMDKGRRGFADDIGGRIKLVGVSVTPKEDAPKRSEGTVICELTVEEGRSALGLKAKA
jgi:acyl-coenzyme A thioesterase 13